MCELKIGMVIRGEDIYLSVFEKGTGNELQKIPLDPETIKQTKEFLEFAENLLKRKNN